MELQQQTDLAAFLQGRGAEDGLYWISQPRAYAHDENDYDRQYFIEERSLDMVRAEGENLMALLKESGWRPGGSMLEIGCGTGRISAGLAMQPDIGHLAITDPSPAFCSIARKKMEGVPVRAGRVDFAVLSAEDVGRLPHGTVSAIVLRSVLHHILDVEAFLAACAGVLPAGGLLLCEEPYYEGYMAMGLLGQFIETALGARGEACTEQERLRIEHFIATMQYYCRRDVDKTAAEDKHLFRPDELGAVAGGLGMKLQHRPNWRCTLSAEDNVRNCAGYFHRFFDEYIRYCMDWPADFSAKVSGAMNPYFRFFEPLESAADTTPHCFGSFVFSKS